MLREPSTNRGGAFLEYRVDRVRRRSRAAVAPAIGHLEDDDRMPSNHLKGREDDRINAVLAAAGIDFSPLLRWVRLALFADP
jgi:hypothetical protein